MDKPQSFDDLQKDLLKFNQHGKYSESLEHLERYRHLVERADIYFLWRSMLLMLSNDIDGTLSTLQQALDQSIWWPPVVLQDEPDFEPLYGLPQFEDLVQRCSVFYEAACRQAHPQRKDLEPLISTQQPPYPALMALHGRGGNLHSDLTYWDNARRQGWLLSLIGSSQVMGQDIFSWDNHSLAEREIKDHLAQLIQTGVVDPRKIILGGFSQAAGLIIRMVLNGLVPVNGLIAVCPTGLCDDDFEHFGQSNVLSGKRVVIVSGEEDIPWRKSVNRLALFLKQKEVPCLYVAHPGLDQHFPADFNEKLPEYLAFLANV